MSISISVQVCRDWRGVLYLSTSTDSCIYIYICRSLPPCALLVYCHSHVPYSFTDTAVLRFTFTHCHLVLYSSTGTAVLPSCALLVYRHCHLVLYSSTDTAILRFTCLQTLPSCALLVYRHCHLVLYSFTDTAILRFTRLQTLPSCALLVYRHCHLVLYSFTDTAVLCFTRLQALPSCALLVYCALASCALLVYRHCHLVLYSFTDTAILCFTRLQTLPSCALLVYRHCHLVLYSSTDTAILCFTRLQTLPSCALLVYRHLHLVLYSSIDTVILCSTRLQTLPSCGLLVYRYCYLVLYSFTSGGRSRKVWGTYTEYLGTTEEPSRRQNWNSRPCSKGNIGSRTAESAHTRYDAGSLSREHLTHVFIDGSSENAVRNGCCGAYICHPDGITSFLSMPAGDLSSNYRAEVHALTLPQKLLIEEDCNQQNIVLLSDSCLLFSLLWTAPLTSHPAATQQPVYSVRQQQSSTPMGASTCWHCRRKRDCRQIGKGSSKTPSTPPLHPIQRCQDLSETEQKQKSFWRLRNNGHGPQKDKNNTLDRRTQTTIFRLRTGHCGLKRNILRD